MRIETTALLAAGLLALAVVSGPAQAAETEVAGWQWAAVPLDLWGVSLRAEMAVNGETIPVEVEFDEVSDELHFAGTIRLEGRNRRAGFLLDAGLIQMEPETEASSGIATADSEVLLLEAAGYYRIIDSQGRLDLIVGVRHMEVDNSISLPDEGGPGSLPLTVASELRAQQDWTDLMAGGRIRAELWKRWDLVVRGDISAGGSQFTWNLSMLFGCELSRHWGLRAGYRILDVDYEDGRDDGFFRFDVQFAGPIFGVAARW